MPNGAPASLGRAPFSLLGGRALGGGAFFGGLFHHLQIVAEAGLAHMIIQAMIIRAGILLLAKKRVLTNVFAWG